LPPAKSPDAIQLFSVVLLFSIVFYLKHDEPALENVATSCQKKMATSWHRIRIYAGFPPEESSIAKQPGYVVTELLRGVLPFAEILAPYYSLYLIIYFFCSPAGPHYRIVKHPVSPVLIFCAKGFLLLQVI
jgi:hypothetical protein